MDVNASEIGLDETLWPWMVGALHVAPCHARRRGPVMVVPSDARAREIVVGTLFGLDNDEESRAKDWSHLCHEDAVGGESVTRRLFAALFLPPLLGAVVLVPILVA